MNIHFKPSNPPWRIGQISASDAGINGPKPVGPGPSGLVLVLGPYQDQEKFQSLGPDRTRTIKIVAVRGSLNKGKPCLVTANPIRPALSKNRDSSKPSSRTDFVLLSSLPAPASCSKSVREETKASENYKNVLKWTVIMIG